MKTVMRFLLFVFAVGCLVISGIRLFSLLDAFDLEEVPEIDIFQDTMQWNEGAEEAPTTETERILAVPAICQYPQLPTGCESVAATMALQYYGVKITAEEFARGWLECSEDFYSKNGMLYGPDPNQVFAGNPFSANSYGCFADPIVWAINRNSRECAAEKITNRSLEELCEEYIAKGKPLLIWATMGMRESSKGRTWYLADGTEFQWISHEHCLVLVGYNEGFYFLNDPISGSTVAYEKDVVERRFSELGMQAVFVFRKGNR